MSKGSLNSSNAPQEHQSTKIKHSHKNRSYNFFPTVRFGEVTPFFFDELVPNDKNVRVGANINIRSLNLKSPLMQDLKLIGRYFVVPYQCILPLNHERLFSNPTIGDDLPRDANCLLSPRDINNFYSVLADDNDIRSLGIRLGRYIRELVVNEVVFNPCGLSGIFDLGFRHLPTVGDNVEGAFLSNTDMLNSLFTLFKNKQFTLYDSTLNFYFRYDDTFSSSADFGRRLITFCTSFPLFECGAESTSQDISDFLTQWYDSGRVRYDLDFSLEENIGPLLAYQLVCAHFYSNDFVDFVYSSDLFRLSVQSLIENLSNLQFESGESSQSVWYFDYNGLSLQYDVFSRKSISSALAMSVTGEHYAFALLITLFRFNRSLKFEDYFSSLKTRPLAVGNTTITPAADGSVSVVDISTRIQEQRFLNAVNRCGRKFEDFQKGIFDVNLSYDFHDPKHIGSFSVDVFSPETDNTGSNQLSEPQTTTSNFRGGTASKAFEFDCDRFSYIIGLMSFDMSRSYCDTTTPISRRYDRFDFFNPYMQYIGDESIPITDYDSRSFYLNATPDNRALADANLAPPFGYGVRHYAYKVRPNVALESFRKSLPSWTFIDNFDLFKQQRSSLPHINSNFIRCLPAELDRYYLSLTGSDYTTYFHFICSIFNRCEMDRPMITAPQIIG